MYTRYKTKYNLWILGTSQARALGFKKQSVKLFYDNLERLYDKYRFKPNRIFNVDETGLCIVPGKQPQIVEAKGKWQIGLLTSAERGSLITLVTAMSADGA